MESFLNRYRNITVLLLVICAQLILLGLQKNGQDVRVIRLWTVTAVTPAARVVEWMRGGSVGFIRNYFVLREAGVENRRLREENGRLRVEVNSLKNELATADRAKALQVFQERTPSRMLAANVIGIGAGSNSKVVYVNRGSAEGVMRGMAVITPDGIVGKVIAAYPTASEVLLVTDSDFAAGVMAQKQQSRGTLKGQGNPLCKVDYVAFEDKVEPGDWFYTSGDDRIFPRGFPVGIVKSIRPAQPYKEILLEPSGLLHGLEDVLIIVSGVHQEIPDAPVTSQPVMISSPPPAPPAGQTPVPQTPGTEADRLRSIYKAVGDAQGHSFGEGIPGSKPPDFTKLPSSPAAVPLAGQPGSAPARGGAGTAPAGGAAAGAGTAAGRGGAATGAGQPGNSPARGGSGTAPTGGAQPTAAPAGRSGVAPGSGQPGNAPGRAGSGTAPTGGGAAGAGTAAGRGGAAPVAGQSGSAPARGGAGTAPAGGQPTTTAPAGRGGPAPVAGQPANTPARGGSGTAPAGGAEPTTTAPAGRGGPAPVAGQPAKTPARGGSGTAPAGGVQPAPGRNPATSPTPTAPPKAQPPDPARRGNQAAGGPGGPPHE